MFDIAVKDINGNVYNFDCEYFVENFDNENGKQSLVFYKNVDVDSNFVENYIALKGVKIEEIVISEPDLLTGKKAEILSYDQYNSLMTATMTCRKGTISSPEENGSVYFQGVATFRK